MTAGGGRLGGGWSGGAVAGAASCRRAVSDALTPCVWRLSPDPWPVAGTGGVSLIADNSRESVSDRTFPMTEFLRHQTRFGNRSSVKVRGNVRQRSESPGCLHGFHVEAGPTLFAAQNSPV